MNELALFAGIGGGVLGSKLLGHRIVCAVEIDAYCREVLLRRQEEGILEAFPIWDDVRTFDGTAWRGKVDVVTAGFPCQPFSVAGKRFGADDERNMWPETIRIIGEVRPRFALLENVPGLFTARQAFTLLVVKATRQLNLFDAGGQKSFARNIMRSIVKAFGDPYILRILGDITEVGYDCRWTIVSAADVGAPHFRKRLWVLAYPCSVRCDTGGTGELLQGFEPHGSTQQLADSEQNRCRFLSDENRNSKESHETSNISNSDSRTISWWDTDPADLPDTQLQFRREGRNSTTGEQLRHGKGIQGCRDSEPTQSFVGRVAHGVAYRVDRLKAIGNGQVPGVVRAAWHILKPK